MNSTSKDATPSFPRRRESSPSSAPPLDARPRRRWMPACAGMTRRRELGSTDERRSTTLRDHEHTTTRRKDFGMLSIAQFFDH
ncbi:MAG: hypothetical protein WD069_02980 [Planctomycetales bacterium]